MTSIFDVLIAQHRETEELFGDVQNAIHTGQLELARVAFQLLSSKLIAGMHAEHTMVYPQFARHAGLEQEVSDAVHEHDAIERAVNHVRVGTVTDEQWCDAVAQLGKLVADHADFEEYTLFPIARLSLTTAKICGLADDYLRATERSTPLAGVSITYDPDPRPPIYCQVRPKAA